MRLCARRRSFITSEFRRTFPPFKGLRQSWGCSCSVLSFHRRLLELVAEDAALEDTIYHLGRGLNSEEADIDLERFLKVLFSLLFRCPSEPREVNADTLFSALRKRVRGLARQQFIARALTNKILLALAVRREQQQQRG